MSHYRYVYHGCILDAWDSDEETNKKVNRWSDNEQDHGSLGDGVFGPVAKPVSNNRYKFVDINRKRKRLRERKPSPDEAVRSKWDTPEQRNASSSSSAESDYLSDDSSRKGSTYVRIGVLGAEELLKSKAKNRHKRTKKRLRQDKKKFKLKLKKKSSKNNHSDYYDKSNSYSSFSASSYERYREPKRSRRSYHRYNSEYSGYSSRSGSRSYYNSVRRRSSRSSYRRSRSSSYSSYLSRSRRSSSTDKSYSPYDSSPSRRSATSERKTRSSIEKPSANNELERIKTEKSKKKNQSNAKLAWQPPLEFGDDVEEEMPIELPKKKSENLTNPHPAITSQATCDRGEHPVTGSQSEPTLLSDDGRKDVSVTSSQSDEQKCKQLKRRNEFREKMKLLQQSVEKGEKSNANLSIEKDVMENVIEGGDAGDQNDAVAGFGFIPKYQPSSSNESEKVEMKVAKTPEAVEDVGIWSDSESNERERAKSQITAALSITTNTNSLKPINSTKEKDLREKNVLPSQKDSLINNRSENGGKSLDKKSVEYESDSDDNELLVHEPLSNAKKTFKFNIKLPKPEPEPEKRKKKTKKNKKANKKEKKTKEKTENEKLQPQPTLTTAVVTSSPDDTMMSSSFHDVKDGPQVTSAADTSTPDSRHPDSQNADQGRLMQPYNPYFSMHPHYMGSRTMMTHTMYHQSHAYQMMGYARHNYMGMGYGLPLPEDFKPPPLPADNEPRRPPEPVFDSKRLSDQKIAKMFQSIEITTENINKFFNDDESSTYLPSPASSRSSSISRPYRRSQQRRRERRRSASSRGTSWSSRSRSRRRSYSRSPSYSRRRRSRSRSYSSYYSSRSRSRSYRSDTPRRGRSRRRRRSRSYSYFSSSRSRDRRSTSYSSSGSDIDRPCRHYRPGSRRSRSRRSSYSSSSGRSTSSRRRRRRSRRSRDRSRSRASYSSRMSYSN